MYRSVDTTPLGVQRSSKLPKRHRDVRQFLLAKETSGSRRKFCSRCRHSSYLVLAAARIASCLAAHTDGLPSETQLAAVDPWVDANENQPRRRQHGPWPDIQYIDVEGRARGGDNCR